jgi:hypothetical protein
MADPVTITNTPPANPGLNYADLLAEGIALTQEFSGEVWTDYNESDPGVTTLEQLCYALTDLSYRAEMPLENLLVERPGGRINPRRQALHPARRIFPCNPLTIDDYRRLLLDRIPSLGNVWLEPHRAPSPRAVNGLYDILIYVPSLTPPPCTPQDEDRELRTAVQRIYVRHRNVCEDLRSICIARPVRTIVEADANIADAPSPETILAQMLFRAGLLLAPEPRRRSLQSLMNDGVEPSAIFNGPLLTRGFIDSDQLPPKAVSIRVQDLIRTMARSAGVISLRGVKVRAGDETYDGNASIPVAPNAVLRLETSPVRGRFTIRLLRNGLEITPDPVRVQRELDRLWAGQRRAYPLSEQYEQFFGFPSGKWADPERYYSIQNQFPGVYGINAYGVPADAGPMRTAQAKQFKGYLMVFDQLLADFFAQLAHAKDLYSTDAALSPTYFFQYLDRAVPNVQPLLLPDYYEGLKRIVAKEDDTIERRNRFLDFLLALYGESLDASTVWSLNAQNEDASTIDARLLHAKLELLRRIVAVSHNRGRGFDYLERPSRGNHSGMEMKIRIQLGMDALDTHPLAEVADELGVHISSDEREPVNGRALPRHTEVIEEQFATVTPSQELVPLNGMSIGESLLRGADVEQIRVGKLPGDTMYSVVWKSDAEWRLASKHADRDNAMNAGAALAASLRTLRRRCQQLYIVEHTLLRYGRFRDDRRDQPFSYSFTATAVLSPPASLRRDDDYRTFAREVIRENTPACVLIDDLFLTHAQMICFEALYWTWRRALRQQNRREMARTSADLREFLQRHETDE